jgi:[3-methyl-2-oxobutanoate dehydrogenase (acetyl-transferring)] kinase
VTNLFTLRTALRFLMKHYSDSQRVTAPSPSFSGLVNLSCKPAQEARRAARESMSICRKTLGQTPAVEIRGDVDQTLPYIPAVLRYMLTEIFKNACRAVVERHAVPGSKGVQALPPVYCDIEASEDTFTIKIQDTGCGMSASQLERIWEFLYTTYPQSQWTKAKATGGVTQSACPAKAPQVDLAGYGVGLPLSRLYARYFGGGDLEAFSEQGQGTEIRMHLNRSSSRCEGLPSTSLLDLPSL